MVFTKDGHGGLSLAKVGSKEWNCGNGYLKFLESLTVSSGSVSQLDLLNGGSGQF